MEYEFRVLRKGARMPEKRVVVQANNLEEAQEKAKVYLGRGQRIDKEGYRVARSAFCVDGAKLTQARIEAGLSMEDVSAVIGGNKSSLSRWERGIVHPSEHAILKLVVLLKRGDFVREK